MNAEERLATELMGWEVSGHCDHSWYGSTKSGLLVMPIRAWHPEKDDGQAQRVIREVARRGLVWRIRTISDKDKIVYALRLFSPDGGTTIYRSGGTTNRSAHIVKAAIAALDSLKPKPHRCEGMAEGTAWVRHEPGTWKLAPDGSMYHMYTHCYSTHCSFCGHDLNVPDSSDD